MSSPDAAEIERLRAEVERLEQRLQAQDAQLDRLRMLSDRAVDSVVLHDGKGRIIDANQHGWQSLGYTRQELLSLNIRDLDVGLQNIPPERYGQNWAKMKPGVAINTQSEHRRKDGTLMPVEVRVAVFERDGERLFVAVSRDVSERRAAERDRERLARRFHAVFQDSPLAMVMTDRAGRLEDVNSAAAAMLGYTLGELGVMTLDDISHPDDHDVGRAEFRELWSGARDTMQVDRRLLTRTGRAVWVKLSAFRDYDHHEGTLRTIAFLEDISERRQIEQQRQQMYAELEQLVGERTRQLTSANARLREEIAEREHAEVQLSAAKIAAEDANRAKSQFLASMSHELRTPLNAVIGYAEMLQEEVEDIGQAQFIPDLEKIRVAGRHLLGIINDILDLSKVEAGKMELSFEDLEIAALVEEVMSTIRPLADKNGNTLELALEPSLGTLQSDVTRVRQILFNLLSNACKFTEQGTVTLTARKLVLDGERWVEFDVADTGIGIGAEQLEHLFKPFTQADASTTRKYGGTGLGLSISHRFCEMLGGSLRVQSEPGVGSTFSLRLPASGPATQSTHPPPPRRADDTQPTVLVVDDDASARDLMTRMLEREGYRVIVAHGGEQALALAREHEPSVITLDVIMPEMDGWTVLAALKAEENLRDIPVVLVTIVGESQRGFALGAADFLTKPVSRERLLSVLRRHRCPHPPCSVLVVDDEFEAREMVRRALTRDGWDVADAADGRSALQRMRELSPAVVLLDLMMPGMDGFEVLEAMRREPRIAHIPVIVLTAKDLSQVERERLSRRVAHVMEKGGRDSQDLLLDVRRRVAQSIVPGP